MTGLHKKRFDELLAQADEIAKSRKKTQEASFHDNLLGWSVKVKNLLTKVCGEGSIHLKSFNNAEELQAYEDDFQPFLRMRAVFLAAKEDFEGGYLSTVRTLVQAEVFGTELEQAGELLAANYSSAAAVIGGVVLETNLRELCVRHGVVVGKLEKMNADLVKAGAYGPIVQKKVTSLAAIRNSAAHGKSEEFSQADVKTMLADIENLLITWLQ